MTGKRRGFGNGFKPNMSVYNIIGLSILLILFISMIFVGAIGNPKNDRENVIAGSLILLGFLGILSIGFYLFFM